MDLQFTHPQKPNYHYFVSDKPWQMGSKAKLALRFRITAVEFDSETEENKMWPQSREGLPNSQLGGFGAPSWTVAGEADVIPADFAVWHDKIVSEGWQLQP